MSASIQAKSSQESIQYYLVASLVTTWMASLCSVTSQARVFESSDLDNIIIIIDCNSSKS